MARESINTLNCSINCPKCGKAQSTSIGFKAGALDNREYAIGDRLSWEGVHLRPKEAPATGNLKTIGYFECDNLNCSSWQDCYPEVQEALISIKDGLIFEAKPFTHKPNEIVFDIVDFNE